MTFLQSLRCWQAYANDSGALTTASDSYQTVNMDTELCNEEFYSLSGDVVTINADGLYRVTLDCCIDFSNYDGGSVAKFNGAEWQVFLNDTTALSPVFTVFQFATNNAVPYSSSSGRHMYTFSASDNLRVKMKRENTTPPLTFQDEEQTMRLGLKRYW